MKGLVRYLNMTNAMAGVETEQGFTVFEVCQRCAIDISDVVSGALDSLGNETLHNMTKNEDFDVRIEYAHCSRTEAVALLGQ
ncbi:MAG: hypothetical protein LBQ00_09770 [Syntrophobacterales bacterium]|jgi:hypothetical protein|nr:hypothetical protein [Syntrophobacterales bacterium]